MIEICFLSKHPQLIPELSVWLEKEFHHLLPNESKKEFADDLKKRLNETKLPLTLIAIENNELVGTASLRAFDENIDKHFSRSQKYSPWLGSVIVSPKRRGEGIGKLLVAKAETVAKKLGFKKLYLFTCGQEKFYAKLGWKKIDGCLFDDYSTAIMCINL